MILRLQKIILSSVIAVLLIGFFIPRHIHAQVSETTTNPNALQPEDPTVPPQDTVGDPVAQTSTEYNPNEVLPVTEPPAGSAGGSILGNLGWFGRALGMDAVDPRTILARIIRSALSFVGIIVLVLILWSGLSYMTAGGDEERSANARRTFFNTLIGLFIILMAYSIVNFVINAFTGTITTSDPVVSPAGPVTPDPVVNP